MSVTFKIERESDGRWVAEVVELPGVLAYGATEDEAPTGKPAAQRRTYKLLGMRTGWERRHDSGKAQSGPACCGEWERRPSHLSARRASRHEWRCERRPAADARHAHPSHGPARRVKSPRV